jgi:hypothetical protein
VSISRRRAWDIAVCVLFWACIAKVGYWMVDRAPPFRLVSYEVPPAKRGGVASVTAVVERDTSRGCSASFSRYLFDSRGFRYALGNEESMTAEMIARMNARAPGRLQVAVPLPEAMAPGPARYVTDLRYVCNPSHFFRPIEVVMEVHLEVLP